MALPKMGVEAVIKGLTSFLGGMKKMDKAIEGVGDESKKTAKKTESFAETFSKVATVTASVGAAMFAAKKAFDFAEEGAQLLRLEQSGENLAKSFGTSMDLIVRAVDKAASGAVARSDIILAANKAMLLGVASSAEQMADLMEVAAVRGKAMGISTTQAFDDIVTGIGRMSPMILDNLGIMTGGAKTFEIYADSVGKTADELTDAEKKQALFNKVVEESQGLLEDAAKSGEDLATSYEQLTTNIKNFTDSLKIRLATEVTGAVDLLNDYFDIQELITFAASKWGIRKKLFLNDFVLEGKIIARNVEELQVWINTQLDAAEGQEQYNKFIQEDKRLRREAREAIKGQTEAVKELATEERRAARDARLLAIETERITQGYSELQLLMKTDLSKSFEDMLDDIDKVNESEEELKKRIWEVNQQIGDYREEIQEIKDEEGPITEAQQKRIDGFNDRISDANGRIAELRGELAQVPERIDEIREAWDLQTKQMIFDLAAQRLATDGLTTEELKALGQLAGPDGFGLIDEAGQGMIDVIAEASDILDLAGDQSDIFGGILTNLQEDISGTTGTVDDLIVALDNLTRDAWLLRVEQDLFGRRAGRGQRPESITGPDDLNNWWDLIQGDVAPTVVTPSGGTSTTNEGDNLNLTINTSAPVEPIVEDFRLMRAMGGRP